MTATTTVDAQPKSGLGNRLLANMQRVGRSLMMPIAVLPAAALLLRFGQPDLIGADGLGWDRVASIMGAAGDALFSNLPILFAIGVAIGFARKADGSTALAALVGYLVFDRVSRAMFAEDEFYASRVTATINDTEGVLNLAAPNPTGVIGGITIGITAALLFQRYSRIKLPDWLAFFGGRRFVPIVTALVAVLLGVLFGLLWPVVGRGIENFGEWMTGAGAFGAGIYGAVNRALVPFGLHHVVNSLVWFVFGEFEGKTGDLNRFFQGDPEAGTFMAGFFPIFMFGLPAAALAMYHEARADRRKVVGGIMLSAGLTSFVTGITEPIEFAFLFIAPVLFIAHVVLTGISMGLVAGLGIKDGFGFSAGLIDYILNFNIATKPALLLPIGLAFGAIYYVLFRFLIRRLDLPTPGRERDGAAGSDSLLDEAQTAGKSD